MQIQEATGVNRIWKKKKKLRAANKKKTAKARPSFTKLRMQLERLRAKERAAVRQQMK